MGLPMQGFSGTYEVPYESTVRWEPDLIIGQTAITGMNWRQRNEFPEAEVVAAGSRARAALRGLSADARIVVLITDPTSFDQPTWEALRWAGRQCEVRFEVLP